MGRLVHDHLKKKCRRRVRPETCCRCEVKLSKQRLPTDEERRNYCLYCGHTLCYRCYWDHNRRDHR